MNKPIHQAALAAMLVVAAAAASAAEPADAGAKATVNFVNIDKMTDVPRFSADRDNLEYQLRDHLKHLSEKLPAGQELKIEFVDIDLAGDVFPRVAIQNVRVMKGRADWPRLHLRYSVEQDGQVLKSGESKLSDPNYLLHHNRYSNEIFSYEKQMLEDWFRKEIVAAR
jgi:hypothetical protein